MKTPDTSFTAKNIDEQIDDLSRSQDEQLLSSSLNAHIVHDLYQVYDSTSYAQHLERSREHIWQHLEAHGIQKERVGAGERRPGIRAGFQQTQGYRKAKATFSSRRLFVSRLGTLAAVLSVALIVGSLVLTLLATRQNESNIGGGPPEPETVTIHMGPASFRPSSVTIHPEAIIRLVNDMDVKHVIENGYWNNDAIAVHFHEPGMPKSPVKFSTAHQSQLFGPFNTVGTYHLFDAIHQDMNLTIRVVQLGTPIVNSPTPSEKTVQVHMEETAFQTSKITISKGMGIVLINDTPIEHIITNGYWKNNKLVLVNEPGMPKVHIVFNAEQQSESIGPFNKVGTYYLVDTVHADMTLTITVK